jgi:hypothetical protein
LIKIKKQLMLNTTSLTKQSLPTAEESELHAQKLLYDQYRDVAAGITQSGSCPINSSTKTAALSLPSSSSLKK